MRSRPRRLPERREADAKVADLAASVFSLAGADWPEDFALLRSELTSRLALLHAPILVNDALGGLRAGAPRWEGIAVVCGTGNAVGARNRDGRVFHLGFWPDRVGGFDLGMEALKAVYRDGLDLGPPTALTEQALSLFGARDCLALIHAFSRRADRLSLVRVQELCPVLLQLAHEGDAVALSIVRKGGRRLGDQARVSAARVGLEVKGATLVLTGGVLQHPTSVLVDAIVEQLPGAVPIRPKVQPLVGALLLAYDALGETMEPERLDERIAAGLTARAD